MSEIDPIEKKRVRWRSRRGLLELDLVLTRFLATRFDALTPAEFAAYVRLLELPDTDFLDLVNGKADTEDAELAPLVAMLRAA